MKPAAKRVAGWRLRSLTPDEEDLWSLVARTVRPLRPVTAAARAAASATDAGKIDTAKKPAGRETSRAMKKAAAPERKVVAGPAAPPALSPIMRREKQKLARGHDIIDARIDLHGMTQTQAHAALRSLLQRCQADGAKFVLVITGKGVRNDSLNGRGVLRRQVPQWLALPEFRRYVAGFDVAHAGHGGEGALYVRLRKQR